MKEALRGALIGFGRVAEAAHAPALRGYPGIKISALCDASAERRALASREFPKARVYASYEELLSRESELDFVDIATPPSFHAEQVLRALARGLHVLCEKPLTTDKSDFQRILDAATSSGRRVVCCHNWAYAPIWTKTWELLPSLGAVRHAELRVLRAKPAASAMPGDWRRDPKLAGGGILVDHGWHNLYLLRRLLNATLDDARASQASCALSISTSDDEAAALFRFPRATGFLHLTWMAAVRQNTAFACGERGTIEILDDELILRRAGEAPARHTFPEKLSAGSAHPEWFSAMLPDFERELRDAGVRGRSLDEAGFVVDLLNKAYLASRTEALA